MLHSFCEGANLRHYFQNEESMQFAAFRALFSKHFDPRHTSVTQYIFGDTKAVHYQNSFSKKAQDVRRLWPQEPTTFPTHGVLHMRALHQGVTFTTNSASTKDCHILCYVGPSRTPVAARISQIIEVQAAEPPLATEFMLVVDEYEALSSRDSGFDYFRAWPLLGCALYYDNCSRTHVIKLKDILCHCARGDHLEPKIRRKTIVILPLNKVTFYTLRCVLHYSCVVSKHILIQDASQNQDDMDIDG